MDLYKTKPKEITHDLFTHSRWVLSTYISNIQATLSLHCEVLCDNETWRYGGESYDIGLTWKFWEQFGHRSDWYDGEWNSFQFLFLWIGWHR